VWTELFTSHCGTVRAGGRVGSQGDGRGGSRGAACRSILEHYQRCCRTQIQPLTYYPFSLFFPPVLFSSVLTIVSPHCTAPKLINLTFPRAWVRHNLFSGCDHTGCEFILLLVARIRTVFARTHSYGQGVHTE
jgi:hypothetical protein